MKKLINAPKDVVREMMEGLVLEHPGLVLLGDETVAVRADATAVRDAGRVALLSGGGAGHEPAHAGYVGPGMLTAAVSGDVFTSPSVDAVLEGIRAIGGRAGVLLVVKNYTGDRLNFGLAAEIARTEGIPVEMVIVADDVALAASTAIAGRRGIAGTVFVHKIAGAAAEAGASLVEVKREAEAAAAAIGTMGVALSPCIVPAAGRPGFALADDELELGLGIHGEAGVRRSKVLPVDQLVDAMLAQIVSDRGIGKGDRVALLVNNLGGTPGMEMAIVTRRALVRLGELGVRVERVWSGAFLTAIEMAGCSLTLMKLDDARLARLDAPTSAPAWPATRGIPAVGAKSRATAAVVRPAAASARADGPVAATMRRGIIAVGKALVAAESRLTELDNVVGDGDMGISLARGVAAVERDLAMYDLSAPAATLRALSATLRRSLGGTSGPLYAIMLLRMAAVLERGDAAKASVWAEAVSEGQKGIAEVGGACLGERTMLDALVPASEALTAAAAAGRSGIEALRAAHAAAREGTAKTAQMMPKRGRSSYLGERALGHVDPGAEAVAIILEALAMGPSAS